MENREIRFRAIKDDISNPSFVYGQLVYDAIGQPRITAVDSSGQGLTFTTCIKGTIGQFIGLLDKNGNEIFEGDIIKYAKKESWCKNEKCETKLRLYGEKFCPHCGEKIEGSDFVRTAEIRFINGGFCFYEEQHKDGDHTYSAWQTFINEIYIEWKEIIGNIHQHPELLTTKPQGK